MVEKFILQGLNAQSATSLQAKESLKRDLANAFADCTCSPLHPQEDASKQTRSVCATILESLFERGEERADGPPRGI